MTTDDVKRGTDAGVGRGVEDRASAPIEGGEVPDPLVARGLVDLLEFLLVDVAAGGPLEAIGHLFDQAGGLVVAVRSDGTLGLANRTWCAALGWEEAEVSGLNLRDVLPAAEHRRWSAWIEDSEAPTVQPARVTWRGRSGQEVPAEGALCRCGTPGGSARVLGVFQDLTPVRRAESLRREAEALLQLLTSQTPIGIFQTDPQGRLIRTNARWRRIAGVLHVEEPRGLWWQIVDPLQRERLQQQWEAFSQHGCEFQAEFTLHTGAGLERFARARIVQIARTEQGAPGCIGVLEDITEQRRTEAELRRARDELDQRIRERTVELEAANRELASFARMVAHDLKAPLRAVSNLAEWLEIDHGQALPPKGREMCRLLQQRVRQMHGLIEGILNYTCIGRSGKTEGPVNLDLLVQEILDLLAVPDHIEIHLPEPLPTVGGVIEELRQVFQNLLDNAVKFLDKPEGEITVRAVHRSDGWLFSVTDNGPGIHPRFHQKIFALFERLDTRNSANSTGIGLALVHRIVELRGGRVWVESTPGEGATFFVLWPGRPARRIEPQEG